MFWLRLCLATAIFLSGFAKLEAEGSPWAESLNRDYGVELQEIEINSLPERHYLRRSFSSNNYRLYSEVARPDNFLHGGFVVVSKNDERILASGRFQQGMFHGPMNIYESDTSRVVLDYQFGRLLQSRQIDSLGNERARDFSLPPQPQAIQVKSKGVGTTKKLPAKEQNLLREIARSVFHKPHSKNVAKMLASFERRLEGLASTPQNPSGVLQPDPLKEELLEKLNETDFVSGLPTQFFLTADMLPPPEKQGSSVWINPNRPQNDSTDTRSNLNQRSSEDALP